MADSAEVMDGPQFVRLPQLAEIGEPVREIEIRPVEEPVPAVLPVEEPERTPYRPAEDPERVPA